MVLAGMLLAIATQGSGATDAAPTDRQVKAAYLYYFAKFVSWPDSTFADAESPLVIGVYGDDPFDGELERMIAGKNIERRSLEIRTIEDETDLAGCHIVYLGPDEKRRAPVVLDRMRGESVLTVSEVEGFIQSGGIVNFFVRNNKVRFAINVKAGERVGLGFRAQLLRVATTIEGDS